MGKKPKARRDMGDDRGESEQKTQSERFIETARKIGVDETGKEFKHAIARVIPPRRSGKTKNN
jgi:hypothetical protein